MIPWLKRKEPPVVRFRFEDHSLSLAQMPWDGPVPRVGERVEFLLPCERVRGTVAAVEHSAKGSHFATMRRGGIIDVILSR